MRPAGGPGVGLLNLHPRFKSERRLGARQSVIAKLAVIEYGALVLREE